MTNFSLSQFTPRRAAFALAGLGAMAAVGAAEVRPCDTVEPAIHSFQGTRVDLSRRYIGADPSAEVPLAPLGVSLGHGIFLDVHNNLMYEPVPAFLQKGSGHYRAGEQDGSVRKNAQGYTLRNPEAGNQMTEYRLTRKGQDTTIDTAGAQPTVIHEEKGQISVTQGNEVIATIQTEGTQTEVFSHGVKATLTHPDANHTRADVPVLYGIEVSQVENKNEQLSIQTRGSWIYARSDRRAVDLEMHSFGNASAHANLSQGVWHMSSPDFLASGDVDVSR